MKVYILHECIDSSDFYAEGNVIMVTKDRIKAIDKMVSLFNESNADELVISYNPMTQLLMDNKNLFLSKRVIYSFGGFAGKLIQKSDTLDKDPIYHNSKKMHKTVMNAVRVYLMLFDILEKGEIKTYRDNDHNFLTQLRNGEYDYKEIRQQLIPAYESRLSVDKSETYLPDNVDWKRVNELVMTVNEESLKI